MNIETANRLVELRKRHNYSQEDLAAALGISRQAVSKWERAEASPDTDNLVSLARLYSISLDELLGNSLPQPVPAASAPELDPPVNPLARTGFPMWFVIAVAGVAVLAIVLLAAFLFNARNLLPLAVIAAFLVCTFTIRKWRAALTAGYPILCVLIYLLCGFVFGSWHPTWLIFLTIPLFYTVGHGN